MLCWILKAPIRKTLQAWLKVWSHFTKQLWSEVLKLINVYKKLFMHFIPLLIIISLKGLMIIAHHKAQPHPRTWSFHKMKNLTLVANVIVNFDSTKLNIPLNNCNLNYSTRVKFSVLLKIFNTLIHMRSFLAYQMNLTL